MWYSECEAQYHGSPRSFAPALCLPEARRRVVRCTLVQDAAPEKRRRAYLLVGADVRAHRTVSAAPCLNTNGIKLDGKYAIQESCLVSAQLCSLVPRIIVQGPIRFAYDMLARKYITRSPSVADLNTALTGDVCCVLLIAQRCGRPGCVMAA